MNKAAIYTALLFASTGILSIVGTYNNHQEIVLEKQGLQFADIERNHLALWPQKNDVFVLEDTAARHRSVYRVVSEYSGSQSAKTVVHQQRIGTESQDDLYVQAINDEMMFADTLDLSYADRVSLLSDGRNYEGRRLLQHERQSVWWKMASSTLTTLPFFVLLGMLIFWMADELIAFFYARFERDWTLLVRHIFIAGLILFFFSGTYQPRFSAHWVSALLRILLTVFPIFYLLQYLMRTHLADRDFPDQELIKFAVIFGGISLSVLASGFVARWLDATLFGATPFTALNTINFFPLTVYFSFAAAAGNLVNNLRKYYGVMSGAAVELRFSQEKALASEAELSALQASVNPHFLYNSLNSIATLSKIDATRTEQMALALSAFYKYAANRRGGHVGTLREELDLIRSYLEIEQIRFGDRLVCTIHSAPGLEDRAVPRFLLQPLVENAIKHGYNTQLDRIEIRIESTERAGELILQVFDNGQPFPENLQVGYGIRSITQKLKLLFPSRHTLAFVNAPHKHVLIGIGKVQDKEFV